MTITNAGVVGTTLNWSASSPQTWLTFNPVSSSLAGGASTTVAFIVNPATLALGTHNATATISDPNASSSPQTIPVTITINSTGLSVAPVVIGVSSAYGIPNYWITNPGSATSGTSVASSTLASSSDLPAELAALRAKLAALLVQAGQGQGSSPTVLFARNLSLWMSGDDVKALQLLLISQASGPAAAKLKAHGATKNFGILTYNALKEFQKKAGIVPASGYFGPKTRVYGNAVNKL